MIAPMRQKQDKGPYHQVYLSHVEHAIKECRTLASLQHSAEKGHIREILLRSVFRPLLPSDLGVGTGFIVGAGGAISSQQDIVLYDRSTLPPALFDNELGIFPIESVLQTIEVKSVLTQRGLTTSQKAAEKLIGMMVHDKEGNMTHDGPRPSVAVFALDSNLTVKGMKEIDRYAKVRGQSSPFLSSLCVVGRGYWWLVNDGFRFWPEQYEFSEVIGFLGGILNAIPQQYEIRRSVRPPLGAYLIDFGADLTSVLLEIGRLGGEVDALLAKGGETREGLADLQERLHTLAGEADLVFGGYEEDTRIKGQQKSREIVEGIERRIQAALAAPMTS